ncbi:MAG: enoyl-CoA hydratase/isomerase family protein [Sphingomonas sp.]|uniref:enoyl-CoA hydratase/isomerase family protein n=1 Tax=Sphingomonas sp. TaxID=28214 RepID=UPI0025F0B84E|nr:enoyl-CoA hydratase-related protein [Sphingomonas sp.]MBX3563527.1 enoyl-CoA hydratase/isomerase family protein [Sphingomonas sp.]
MRVADRIWETLSVTVDAGIATIAFARPDKFNAMNLAMRDELFECFDAIARDQSIRCVILTGQGKAFSAGGDINDFRNSPGTLHNMMGRLTHRWVRALWNLPQPVVAAVNGVAAGGGASIALLCDIVVASEEASFVHTFMNVGLVPDLGGMFVLPRLVGLQKAKELAFLGEKLSAREAFDCGLVNRVVPAPELMEHVSGMAARLAGLPSSAVTMAKRTFNRSFESAMDAVLDAEWMAQSYLFGTEESQAGVSGFLSKSGAADR